MFRTGPGPDAGGSNAKEKSLPHCPEKSGTAVISAADAGEASIQPKPKMKRTRAISMKRSDQKTSFCVIVFIPVTLEHRNRIDRRSRRIGERERIDDQRELIAIAGGGRVTQRLQIGAVEYVDTENRHDEIVHGVLEQISGHLRRVASGFPDDQRHVALFQPRQDRIVEPRGSFFRAKLGSPAI